MSDSAPGGAGAVEPGAPASRASQADFVAGVVIGLVAIATLVESVRMPYYEEGRRGLISSPGLTPGLLSLGLIVMSALLVFRSRGFKPKRPRLALSVEARRVLGVVAILVAYVVAIRPLGYVVATFVMMSVFQTVYMERRTVKTIVLWSIGLSALITGVLYYAFAHVFLIPIP